MPLTLWFWVAMVRTSISWAVTFFLCQKGAMTSSGCGNIWGGVIFGFFHVFHGFSLYIIIYIHAVYGFSL